VDVGRESEAGEVGQVLAGFGELLGERNRVRPEAELVAARRATREPGRCPRPGAKYADAAQAMAFLSRSGFCAGEKAANVLVCLTMTSNGRRGSRR